MDLSKECLNSLFVQDINETSDCHFIYLSKRPDGKRVPLYRFNLTDGAIKTNHNGYSRFYAQVTERTAHELGLLKNHLIDVAEQYLLTEIQKTSLYSPKDLPTIEMNDLIVEGETSISFPINKRTKYRIQTQHRPFESQELHLDTVKKIACFNGSMVLSIPWMKYYSSNTFEPYAVIYDLLIKDITEYYNPHYTTEFFSQITVPNNIEWMNNVVERNQYISQT